MPRKIWQAFSKALTVRFLLLLHAATDSTGVTVCLRWLVAAITFVENPGLLGVVYFPPIGDLTVVCSTLHLANITWVSSRGDRYKTKLNITQATNRKSILYVRYNDDSAKGILVFGGPFRCQARDLTTLQEKTTDYFYFRMGRTPSILRQLLIPTEQGHRLLCVISLDLLPPVSVTWIFESGNGQSEKKNSTTERVAIVNSELQVFLDVSGKESNGTYRCIARNEFGVAESSPINVIVAYLGNISYSIDPSSGRVVENNDVRVLAQVDSYPAPFRVTISHNGVLKTVNDTKTLEYTFKANRNDTGTYVVGAVHVSGSTQRSFQITVLSPPGEVKFFIVNVSHNSITYRWAVGFDGNVDITIMTLCCGENADNVSQNPCSVSAKSQETDVLTSSRTEDTLLGLLPNTMYYCELFGTNEIGRTPSGIPQLITTKPTVPSEPNITSCISKQETSLLVNLTTFNGGSTITRYIIRYQIVGSINEEQRLTQTDGITQTRGSVQLTNLNKLTKYSVQVAAENSVGRSSFGQTECLTTCDLLAPIQLNSTRVAIKGGYALQFYVEEKCGNVREFVSTSCSEKPLTTKSSQLTGHTFWVNITGLKTSQHCVMVKATTVTEISSKYAVIEIALGRGRNEEDKTKTVAIAVSLAVLATCLMAFLTVCLYQKHKKGQMRSEDKQSKKESRHKKDKHERSSPASAEKRGRLREEVELHAVKHDQQVAMQDSNAYGVLPGAKNARDDSETCDYLNDSPVYARVRVITSS